MKKQMIAFMLILCLGLIGFSTAEAGPVKLTYSNFFPPAHIQSKLAEAWCKEVEKENIGPFNKFLKTIKAHWTGIVNFSESSISNGILEGINSKVQLAKRRARGYRCLKNLTNMIYFLCGKLKFGYPLVST